MKISLSRLLLISRPKFWLYTAGPYLIGFTAAANSLADFMQFSFWYSLFYFLIPANFILYGVNDIADKDTDAFNTKKITHESKATDQNNTIYRAIVILSLLLAIPLFFYLSVFPKILFAIFLMLGIGYSLPPIRFKAKPYVDSLSNILYAVPAFVGIYQIRNDVLTFYIFLAALCWTAAMHLFSAVPDIQADKKAGLRTTAVVLGYRKSLFVCGILWAIAAINAILINWWFIFMLVYPVIPFALLKNRGLSIERVYWLFPYINALVGFILFIFAAAHLR